MGGLGNRGLGQKKKALNLTIQGENKKLGSDLLSHTLVCSTIGDERLDF